MSEEIDINMLCQVCHTKAMYLGVDMYGRIACAQCIQDADDQSCMDEVET